MSGSSVPAMARSESRRRLPVPSTPTAVEMDTASPRVSAYIGYVDSGKLS